MAKDNKTEIVKAERIQAPMVLKHDDTLFNDDLCQQVDRVAAIFASSDIVPTHFRGKKANCFIAIHQAKRLGVDAMMMMQHTYVVHGKIGLEAKMAIALMNSRGPFKGPVQWEIEGEGPTRQATAWGEIKGVKKRCEATVTMAMVKAEGWDKDRTSKWHTLTDLMLQYRSATFLARLYCPEVLMGMHSVEELRDIESATPPPEMAPGRMEFGKKKALPEAEVIDVEPDPAPEPTPDPAPEVPSPVTTPEETPVEPTPPPEEGFTPSIGQYVRNGSRGQVVRVTNLDPPKFMKPDGSEHQRSLWPPKVQAWDTSSSGAITDEDGVIHPDTFDVLVHNTPEPEPDIPFAPDPDLPSPLDTAPPAEEPTEPLEPQTSTATAPPADAGDDSLDEWL